MPGPHTLMPLTAKTKPQNSGALSTPEAEVPTLNMVVRSFGMLALDHWELVLGRKVGVDMMEGHEASLAIVRIGANPTRRRLSRTHGVSVAWLYETFQ